MALSSEERRKYRRVSDQFNVRVAREVRTNEFKDMAIDVAKSVNISASGMLMHLKEDHLKAKDIIRVTFLKPNTFEFFEGLARVIRVDENKDKTYHVGVHFFNLSTSEMNKLDYYIRMCEQ
ncbi:MAG: PilZ domain-containing protein [Spirochaetes bacterium]|nr:PilZ domain-containing protein [Spirochaetota bacterium]